VIYQALLSFRVFGLSTPNLESRRADSNRLPLSLRVITQALQRFAQPCKSRISRRLSLLRVAHFCTVLRSRWYQIGINGGIASSQYCSLAHASEVRPAPRRAHQHPANSRPLQSLDPSIGATPPMGLGRHCTNRHATNRAAGRGRALSLRVPLLVHLICWVALTLRFPFVQSFICLVIIPAPASGLTQSLWSQRRRPWARNLDASRPVDSAQSSPHRWHGEQQHRRCYPLSFSSAPHGPGCPSR
jgi:hypothetical protein